MSAALSCAEPSGLPWKSMRLRPATARPAFSALIRKLAAQAPADGSQVSSREAASAQASAAFCSSVFCMYRRPPSSARPAKPIRMGRAMAAMTATAPRWRRRAGGRKENMAAPICLWRRRRRGRW
ncbi:hypothetical protein D3C86_1770690 [compost metagenome]